MKGLVLVLCILAMAVLINGQFPTQLRITDGSVGVFQSHDRASFLFYTQEIDSGCQRATNLWRTKASPAGVHF